MQKFSRRDFLAAGTAAAGLPLLPWTIGHALATANQPAALEVSSRTIEVNGKAASVYGIMRPDGGHGLHTEAGAQFNVRLTNRLTEPTLVHWHGLTPPYRQDGVPGLSQPLLAPQSSYDYSFPLVRPGTYWMHSHAGLQEQLLLAAPLIVRDPAEAGIDEQEVVVLLHDFSFRDPEETLATLQQGGGRAMGAGSESAVMAMGSGPGGMDHSGMNMSGMDVGAMDKGAMSAGDMTMDVNDVEFDAYLANDRTLGDPQVISVDGGGQVRLRIINGASATNFTIDIGTLEGALIAVDGHPVVPVTGSSFEIAISQRLDVRLRLPSGQGSYPILARREGAREQTGIVLATKSAQIGRIMEEGENDAPQLGLAIESGLRAAMPLATRPSDRRIALDLTGTMAGYNWTLNGARYGEHQPLLVGQGERIEVTLRNRTEMAHPMHLHGHVFQVVAIGEERFAGASRDSVLVPRNASVTLAFDADNPGRWAFHCHHLYHMASGMMTTVEYTA